MMTALTGDYEITKHSLQDEIVQVLRKAIISGEVQPGQRLLRRSWPIRLSEPRTAQRRCASFLQMAWWKSCPAGEPCRETIRR